MKMSGNVADCDLQISLQNQSTKRQIKLVGFGGGWMDAIKTLERLARQARERQDSQPVQLPVWPDSKRAAPHLAFRSALFPALGKGPRQQLNEELIYSVGSVEIRFTGRQFDQSDLDVWLQILHAMRGQHAASFSANAMLDALGRKAGGSDHAWLRESIDRLTDGTVRIISENRRYSGHLVDSVDEDVTSQQYSLSLNPKLVRLFLAGWSSLVCDYRRQLKSPTAKSLHAYYSSHINPGFHRWETLASVVGAKDTNKRRQRARLKSAIEDLVAVGFLSGYSDTDQGVTVIKAG